MTGFGFADPDEPRLVDASRSQEYRDAAEGWVDSLRDEERDALERYTQAGFESINQAFYDGDGVSELSGRDQFTVQSLDRALGRAPAAKEPVTVWRGVNPGTGWGSERGWDQDSARQWAHEGFPVGSTVTFPSYTSTSRSASVAAHTAEAGILFEMRTRQGAYVGGVGSYDDMEQEHLIGRGSSWRVVGVEDNVAVDVPGQQRVHRTVVYLVDESLTDPVESGPAAPGFSARPTAGWVGPRPTRSDDPVMVPAAGGAAVDTADPEDELTGIADDADEWMRSMLEGDDPGFEDDDGWGGFASDDDQW